jgi:hypothetical protein
MIERRAASSANPVANLFAKLTREPLPPPPDEPAWVTEILNARPYAKEALGAVIGLYDGPETDAEMLDALKSLDETASTPSCCPCASPRKET